MKKVSKIVLFVTVFTLILVLFTLVTGAKDVVSGSKITEVRVDGDKLTVSAGITGYYVGENEEIALFPVIDGDLNSFWFPLDKKPAADTLSFTVDFDSFDAGNFQNGYVLCVSDGVKYTPISPVAYIDNVRENGVNPTEKPKTDSIKGLQVQLITDAVKLGVKHSSLTVFLNDLVSRGGEGATEIFYGKKTFYIDNEELKNLDNRVKELSNNGITVYINLLYGNSDGVISLPTVEENANPYTAITYFLAERYSEYGSANGFCADYIIGYELDDGTNGGASTLGVYADGVSKWIRTLETAILSAYKNADIYISLSSRWEAGEEIGQFGGRALLDALETRMGGLPFGISLNAYTPSGLYDDEKLENDGGTEYVSLKNIEVLADRIGENPIIIGEYGVKCDENDAPAEYLKAYNKAVGSGVRAFILHRHVDFDIEDAKYGLYSSVGNLDAVNKKPIWDAVYYADLDSPEAEEYINTKINLKIGGYKRTVTQSGEAKATGTVLFDFDGDENGFLPTGGTAYLGLDDGFMRVVASRTSSPESFGCVRTVNGSLFSNTSALGVRLRVSGEGELKVYICLESGGKTVFYEKTVKNGAWENVSFDISALKADRSDVIMRVYAENGIGNQGLTLDIEKIESDKGDHTVLLVLSLAVTGLGVCVLAFAVVYFVKLRKRSGENHGA